MRKVYIILEHCRGRTEITTLIFSTLKKAKKYCEEQNALPEPSMGWASSYSYKEVELNAIN